MADSLDLLVRTLAWPVVGFLLANGTDDLFIDVNYFVRGLFRRGQRRISVKDLKSAPQKRIAIMIPAWQEANVIQKMLELNLSHIDYAPENFDIFVGTYVNDPATQERVEAVARTLPNVHLVVTPHDGPTCKADNLNWIYQGLRLLEETSGQRFDILLMHDAEDIIHPLALRLYNYYVPTYEFIQTPVFPLDTPWYEWVAGTYIDEFTEYHLKDMLVRESMGGLVPSAGVGSAFARDAFEDIALSNSQQAFNTRSLTEDYEIGMKFRLAGKRAFFLNRAVSRVREVERGIFRKRLVREEVDEYIATREFFPSTMSTSIAQRSRWVLGIALQAWEQLGWRGPFAVRYCLWRDRKALLTSYVAPLAYLLAIYCLVRLALGGILHHPWSFDNVFVPGSWLWYMVLVNTILLIWRAVMKVVTVEEVYGPRQALLSMPRFFVSNLINLAATSRAIWQYTAHRITGKPLRWLKTRHEFPNVETLRSFHRSLGELLVDREGLTRDELEQALVLHRQTGVRLGEVCAQAGFARQDVIVSALSDQLALEVVKPNPYDIPVSLLRQLPESEAEELGVLPLSVFENGTVQFATASPPSKEAYARLEGRFKARVSFGFCLDTDLDLARQRAYRRLLEHIDRAARTRPLGEQLVAARLITRATLGDALSQHDPSVEPLGEYLVRLKLVDPRRLSRFLEKRFQESFRPLSPGDGDPVALRRLGYGFCSLHGILPLRVTDEDGTALMAAAYPLHDQVTALVMARVGAKVKPVLSPALDVRMALSLAARTIWPEGISHGVGGLDGAELATLESMPDLDFDLPALYRAALAVGESPLEHLERTGQLQPASAARIRGQVFGIPIVPADQAPPEAFAGWLPDSFQEEGEIAMLESNASMIVVATHTPSPFLTARLVQILPDTAIAWRVLYGERPPAAHRDAPPQGEVPAPQPPPVR